MNRGRSVIAALALALSATARVLAADAAGAAEGEWSRFRGPNGTGVSAATTVPVRWTDADYNWRALLPGPGHSSPVVWGDRIYVTCGDPATATRTAVCLAVADGRTLWQRQFPSVAYEQHRDNSYATATPAADADGVVLTWTTPQEVVLLALDREGRDVWRRNLGPFVGMHGSGTSPIIYGGLVVLGNDQEGPERMLLTRDPRVARSFLVAVDRKTGATRWLLERRSALAAYSTPCVYQPPGARPELIFTSTAHGVTSVDPATGKVNWEVPDVFKDRCVASPVWSAGLVFAGFGYGSRGTRYVAVRPASADGKTPAAVAYDLPRPVPLIPTPVVKDGRLFLWTDDGVVACLKVETGEVVWRERVGGSFYGSPVWVDGRLYAIARNGDVVVVSAGDAFQLLARVPLGEPSYATPAVAGGVMYLRTATRLYSLGGRKAGAR